MWRDATGRLLLRQGWCLCKTVLLVITMIGLVAVVNGVVDLVADHIVSCEKSKGFLSCR